MTPLYRQALALVMPTYFGPTNLPPLEALRLGTPVVYPSDLAAASGLSDVVYGIDLADPATLSDALHALVLSRRAGMPPVDADQVAKVLSLLDDEDARRRTLESVLTGYAQRRACWP
jgi:glycosyltransferase involved in cell wall biosynthesis